jgi:ABC transporter
MTPIIEARGLTKRFGDVRALDGLDLVAEPGRVTALLGPNGAGKTTFVSAVATLLRPDEGVLRVAGIDAASEPRRVRQVIGLAGQHASVEPAMTGTENLGLVARLSCDGGEVGVHARTVPRGWFDPGRTIPVVPSAHAPAPDPTPTPRPPSSTPSSGCSPLGSPARQRLPPTGGRGNGLRGPATIASAIPDRQPLPRHRTGPEVGWRGPGRVRRGAHGCMGRRRPVADLRRGEGRPPPARRHRG